MKNKIFLFVLGIILFIGFTSASINDLGYYSPNTCIELLQTCQGCSFNNISSIMISNGGNNPVIIHYSPNLAMSSSDTYTYNVTFCNTTVLGTYFVNGVGNDGGTTSSWTYQFEIGLPLWIVITVLIIGYVIAFLGFFKYRNEYISMAGGMVMAVLGIYLTQFGLSIYNNTLTLVVGYITIVLGAVALLVPIAEKLEVDMNFFDNK